jgi:hypothetical protein
VREVEQLLVPPIGISPERVVLWSAIGVFSEALMKRRAAECVRGVGVLRASPVRTSLPTRFD